MQAFPNAYEGSTLKITNRLAGMYALNSRQYGLKKVTIRIGANRIIKQAYSFSGQ